MIAALTNHLWQSSVVVIAVALLSLALRRNRASVRHALWMTASLKFAVPFSLLIALGGVMPWPETQAPEAPIAPAVVAAVGQFAEPFPDDIAPAAPADTSHPAANLIPILLASIWAAGCCAAIAMRIRSWRHIRAAVRAGMPVTMNAAGLDPNVEVRSTPGLLEPGVVGIWRPMLLVPDGLESILTADQLRAVLIHEQHHILRRDNLTSAMHMVVEAVFWFHPLVWWIGARLVAERERACDEHVLAVGAAPEIYAEGILNVCKRYAESPLACVSGVTGSDLKKRVSAILANRIGARLNLTRRVALSLVAVAALVAPVLAGAITAPASARAAAGKQKFDVASIRPCEDSPSVPGGRRGGVGPVFSPGMLVYNCGTLLQLIHEAYVTNGEALLNNAPVMRIGAHPIPEIVRGGPDWARTERFMIEAKAAISTGLPGNQAPERQVLMGPMLRALLEERFKVVMHREFEKDVPMYALRVAKGGLKIKPAGPDSCIPYDGSQPPPIPMNQEVQRVRDGGKPYCGHGLMGGALGPNHAWVLNGQTMEGLAWVLSNMMDRHVIDETGVADKFVMYLEYAPDDMVPFDTAPRGTDPPTAPSITQVLKTLGLELQPTKAPKQYIVIDHAERPSFAPASAGATEGKPVSAGVQASDQKFEVASIRPCENTPNVPGGRNGGVGPVFSPGLFVYNCGTLEQLINGAYVANGDPLLNDEGRGTPRGTRDPKAFPDRIRGGPDWVRSDRFMIEAKTSVSSGRSGREALPERAILMGPMLRALLEDRFKLQVHRDVQNDVAMYALTIAKGGLKIKPAGSDSCAPSDPNRTAPYQMSEEIETVRKGGKPICGHGIMGGPIGPNHAVVLNGQTMEGIARWLSNVMDRHVLDHTGVSDKFVIFMEYAPDDLVPYDFRSESPDQPTAPSITQVLKSLGLELQPTKGPKGFIVIDHVEHPTPGFPAFAAEAATADTPAAGRAGGR